jgi:2-oxoglutarate ferredoxin oxidoreductase subunit alpha
MLDDRPRFRRYLEVDGDGIPYRTYPGTPPDQRFVLHPRHLARTLRALFRGRLGLRRQHAAIGAQFETAQDMVPRPLQANAAKPTKYGVIYFGSTRRPWTRRSGSWNRAGISSTACGSAPFPFHSSVAELHRRP